MTSNNMWLKVFINVPYLVCHVIIKHSLVHQYGTQVFSRKPSFISVFQLPDSNTRLQVQRFDASMGTARQLLQKWQWQAEWKERDFIIIIIIIIIIAYTIICCYSTSHLTFINILVFSRTVTTFFTRIRTPIISCNSSTGLSTYITPQSGIPLEKPKVLPPAKRFPYFI